MKQKNRTVFWFAIAAVALICSTIGSQDTMAQQRDFNLDPFASPIQGSDGLYSLEVPLSDLAGRSSVMRLVTSTASEQIGFSVSPSIMIQDATLRVRLINSNALIDRSQIRVLLNGLTVAQLPIAREDAYLDAVISLDPTDFVQGFNSLQFVASQHYTNECEDPEAPELWSEIDLRESSLGFTWSRESNTTTLADIGDLFDRSIGGLSNLRVLLPAENSNSTVDIAAVNSAALIVQRVANQQIFTQPNVQAINLARYPLDNDAQESGSVWGINPQAIAGEDALLVGTVDQLAPYLAPGIANVITDSYVGLFPSPVDPTRFLLVVSGRNVDQVHRAAKALSIINFPFADARSMLVPAADIAPDFRPFAQAPVRPNRKYAFSDFGFSDRLFEGWRAPSSVLRVPIPGNFYVPEGTQIRVGLDFGYSNGLRADSALNIFLNGKLTHTIPLDADDGIGYRDFGVFMDFREFEPGINEIRFDTVMVPETQEPCRTREEDALLLSLEASSTIEMPQGIGFAEVPDLLNWSRTGYPFVSAEGYADFDVVMLDGSVETVEATWLLLGRLAQISGRVFTDITIVDAASSLEQARHVVVIGGFNELAGGNMAMGPVRLGSPNDVPYIGQSVRGGTPPRSVLERYSGPLYDGLQALGLVGEDGVTDSVSTTRLVQVNELGRNGLLQAYERQDAPGNMALLVTAATPALLKNRMRELVDPAYWSQLEGDLAVWRDEPNSFAKADIGTKFQIGELGAAERFRFLTAAHPLVFVGLIFGCVLLISIIVVVAVRDLRRRSQTAD